MLKVLTAQLEKQSKKDLGLGLQRGYIYLISINSCLSFSFTVVENHWLITPTLHSKYQKVFLSDPAGTRVHTVHMTLSLFATA